MKLQDLCELLGVDYDKSRYALAQGILPKGVDPGPGRGNHRLFNPAQAFYLAIGLKLMSVGVLTSLAKKISEWSRVVQGTSCNLGWDPRFAPFSGGLHTEHQWFIDVGDGRYARLATDANPSQVGLHETPWVDMSTRRKSPSTRPAVIFRVDIALIAKLLEGRMSPSGAAPGE